MAGAVAEVVDALKAALGDQRVDPVFEFAAGESAGDACAAAAGQDGVLEQRARLGAEPKAVPERHVPIERANAPARPDHVPAGQPRFCWSLMDDEERAVVCGSAPEAS